MPTVYTEVEVDVDLDDFDDEDLLDEIERRGLDFSSNDDVVNAKEIIAQIYQLKRTGQSYEQELDNLISCVLGRI